ncbi:amidase signature domain-containing protein [Aspergillus insuetus]
MRSTLGLTPRQGTTKTSQFVFGLEPWYWQDVRYPWNPRGDRYLHIADSSAGRSAAISSYDWLNFALGSDTGGSVRMPAALGGNYGIQPTWNSQDLTGLVAQTHLFDSAGIFTRDPRLFARIANS